MHAYIADQIAKKAGWKNMDEMYGSMAPDVINYMFSSPYLSQMYAATHFDFEPLWEEARTVRERALAHGFVMHNNAWAADYTAHNHSLTLASAWMESSRSPALIRSVLPTATKGIRPCRTHAWRVGAETTRSSEALPAGSSGLVPDSLPVP